MLPKKVGLLGGFRNGKNVENNPQVNTRAVSICTYACTGRSQALSKTIHKRGRMHFGRKVKEGSHDQRMV